MTTGLAAGGLDYSIMCNTVCNMPYYYAFELKIESKSIEVISSVDASLP